MNTFKTITLAAFFAALVSAAHAQSSQQIDTTMRGQTCTNCGPGTSSTTTGAPPAPVTRSTTQGQPRVSTPPDPETYQLMTPLPNDRAVPRGTGTRMAERGAIPYNPRANVPRRPCGLGSGCWGVSNPVRGTGDAIVPTADGSYVAIQGSYRAYREYLRYVQGNPAYAGVNYGVGVVPGGYYGHYGLVNPIEYARDVRSLDLEEFTASIMLTGSERFLNDVMVFVNECGPWAGNKVNSPRTSDSGIPVPPNAPSKITLIANIDGVYAGIDFTVNPQNMAIMDTASRGKKRFQEIPVKKEMFFDGTGALRRKDPQSLSCQP